MGNSDNIVFVFSMYTFAMLVLPLFTFFTVKNLLEKEFHITGFSSTAWSVLSAVVIINLIIMAYAWRAYKQEVAEEGESPKNTEPALKIKKDD